MCRDGDEVGFGERNLARSLSAIGKQQRSGGADHLLDVLDRLDHARFIVDELDRDESRSRCKLPLKRFEIDKAHAIQGQDSCALTHRGNHHVMLGRTDDAAR